MLNNCRGGWGRDYAHLAPHKKKKKKKKKKKRDAVEEWLYRKKEEDTAADEFRRYSIAGSAVPATKRFDPITWWSQPDIEEAFPTLQRWALVIFACPTTSCDCEQAFSSAKKLITPERNSLGDNIIEALEGLRAWWNNGLIKRL
jgi:hypothetical protein